MMKNKTLMVAGLFLVSLTTVLAEESLDETDLGMNDLLEESLLFDEIPSVYSASKYEQKVTKAPASVSIVTADEIKKQGYRTFADILKSLKGFYATNDRNYGYAGVRGFGLPSDYNTRLLLLIDGHRFNDNIYESFVVGHGFPVDVDVIERVEVVRGPGSSLYGTSAFLGVINVITKRGRDLEGVSASASYASNDAFKTRLSYGQRFDNGFEAFVSGTFFDTRGDESFYSKAFDDPATNHGISVKNDEQQSIQLLSTLSYKDFTLQAAYLDSSKAVPTASFSTVFNHPDFNTQEQILYVDLKYEHTFENQLNLITRLSYNQYKYFGDYPFDYSETDDPFIVINKDTAHGQSWRAELQLSKTLWQDHRLTGGLEFQDNFQQYQDNFDLEVYVKADKTSDRWAAFIQNEWSINEYFTLNVGVRYDYYSTFGNTINPRAALIYNPAEGTAIKLLYGEAFRAPNDYEFNYHDAGNTTLPSEDLKPEKLRTLELIFEHYFTPKIRGEANLFYTEIDDILSLATTADNLLQNQNTGKVRSYGSEIQLEASWWDGFQGRFSYSWQNTQSTTTNERLRNSPEHLVKINLIAPVWQDKLFAGLETQYMSERSTSLGGKVGDHVLTNLTLSHQNWIDGLELSASVYNLFDERYFDPGSEEHTQNGIEQEGLEFRIQASFEY